ncbi:hypothetical protein [Acidisoma cladoniae]|uniref:hypothetical protein n=1 Tax=Acidisoma cladoniae TaxID=3040935 RepID=UPI00254E5748|nr:hypothetical protein [Acidisoma sp. PAMC 29798]
MATTLGRRGAIGAATALMATAATGSQPACAAAADPVVALWAKTQAVSAELDRVSGRQNDLRLQIIERNPTQPPGVMFADWYRGDPDLPRCTSLRVLSNKLCSQSSDLYDEIALAAATTPQGIRAKCAAAISLLVLEPDLRDEMSFYDLVLNALREAAAGSAE